MQTAIGISFIIAGLFYMAFAGANSFTLAVFMLAIAHAGGSTLWVNSTVLLQSTVEDNFRGRVFAAELALLMLTMAGSNYVTGELLDRFGYSPRVVTAGIGVLFIIPGLVWLTTKGWWDKASTTEAQHTGEDQTGAEQAELETEGATAAR
jgi:hypothetical protein